MSRTVGLFFFLGFLFLGINSNGQNLGLLPYKTKWQELRHDSLSIIFPEGHEASAKRIGGLMLKLASVDPMTTEGRYKPISVILQPFTTESNGYVGLAPYVSELMLQPYENPFILGSLHWEDLLAIHEYRHVQQVNAVNTGISHIIKMLLGERAFAGMYGLAIANWLREGEAIDFETKWTPQGRGRLSRFTLPFREKNRKDEFWKYYVLRNGSYKQNVPDQYPLGYLMTMYGNHAFGEATWDTIFRLAPRMNPIYDPFSGVVKKFYGKSNRFLYEDAVKYYGAQCKEREVTDITYPTIPISEKNSQNAFFDMAYPSVGGDGAIYTSITSFDSIATIYKIASDGRRKKIVSQGRNNDTYFDYSNDRLVWTERRVDARWLRTDKNVIVVYYVLDKKKKDFKTSKGYFTPSLDLTGNKIVALQAGLDGKFALHILDANTGQILNELPNPENLYFGYPSFDDENKTIIATARNSDGRMCLLEQDIETGIIKQITHYSYNVLGRHAQAGPWIFLTCGIDDVDQVYAVDRKEGVFYQVSGGNQAHYNPTWDPVQDNLVCSQYANNGSKLVRLPGLPRQWLPTNLDDGIKYIPGASARNILSEPLDPESFEQKDYSPWKNAINYYGLGLIIHAPLYGLELRSQNILKTISMAGGYAYNRNNRAGGPYFDVSLGMWYPVLQFGYKNTTRRPTAVDSLHLRTVLDEVFAGISLPLHFTPGVYQQSIEISSLVSTGNRKIRILDGPLLKISDIYYARQRIVFINSRKKAYRQPIPSFAQRLEFSLANEITGTQIQQWFASTDFAFPGIRASNYTILTANMLIQDNGKNNVRLNSQYVGARGFQFQDGGTNYKFGFTYGFPLLYPDIGFGNVLYVPRIRLQPFYDLAYSDSVEAIAPNMSSAGAELLIDFYLSTFTLGIRYSRLLTGYEGNPNRFEVFIPSQRF